MNVNREDLMKIVESKLGKALKVVGIPPQGMDSEVFAISDEDSHEYIVKVTSYRNPETEIYKILESNNVNAPFPKTVVSFEYNNGTVLILEKISKPILDSIPVGEMSDYIPSMIETMNEIHKVKSDKPGKPWKQAESKGWKSELLSTFTDESLDWDEIYERNSLDGELVKRSVKKFMAITNNLSFLDKDFSLLHIDYNQRNLFVDTTLKKIAGIVDWSGAIFGDPIYDFARIRMYIWHFNLGQEAVDTYYKMMNYTSYQKKLDDYYWLYRVIEYLAYYSEEPNEFNNSRIKLHQDFLRNYQWELFNK